MDLQSGTVIDRIDLFDWMRVHERPKKETSSLMLAWELREEMGRMDAILERLENEIRQERISNPPSRRHTGTAP